MKNHQMSTDEARDLWIAALYFGDKAAIRKITLAARNGTLPQKPAKVDREGMNLSNGAIRFFVEQALINNFFNVDSGHAPGFLYLLRQYTIGGDNNNTLEEIARRLLEFPSNIKADFVYNFTRMLFQIIHRLETSSGVKRFVRYLLSGKVGDRFSLDQEVLPHYVITHLQALSKSMVSYLPVDMLLDEIESAIEENQKSFNNILALMTLIEITDSILPPKDRKRVNSLWDRAHARYSSLPQAKAIRQFLTAIYSEKHTSCVLLSWRQMKKSPLGVIHFLNDIKGNNTKTEEYISTNAVGDLSLVTNISCENRGVIELIKSMAMKEAVSHVRVALAGLLAKTGCVDDETIWSLLAEEKPYGAGGDSQSGTNVTYKKEWHFLTMAASISPSIVFASFPELLETLINHIDEWWTTAIHIIPNRTITSIFPVPESLPYLPSLMRNIPSREQKVWYRHISGFRYESLIRDWMTDGMWRAKDEELELTRQRVFSTPPETRFVIAKFLAMSSFIPLRLSSNQLKVMNFFSDWISYLERQPYKFAFLPKKYTQEVFNDLEESLQKITDIYQAVHKPYVAEQLTQIVQVARLTQNDKIIRWSIHHVLEFAKCMKQDEKAMGADWGLVLRAMSGHKLAPMLYRELNNILGRNYWEKYAKQRKDFNKSFWDSLSEENDTEKIVLGNVQSITSDDANDNENSGGAEQCHLPDLVNSFRSL